MNKASLQQNLNRELPYFSAHTFEDIIKISLKDHLMLKSTNLRCRDTFIAYLSTVSENPSIKVIILEKPFKATTCSEYIEFYDSVTNSELSENDVLRMCRSYDQVILKIVESNKFFISVDSGELFPQAFNISLACDYRLIAGNTTIKNTFLDFGFVPKGGSAYFLNKIAGHCKACELLLTNKDIHADEAMKLGIVNKVVPTVEIEKRAFETAKYFAHQPATSLSGIKRLLNYSMKDLADYLEFETQELLNTLGSFSLGFKNRDPKCEKIVNS